MRTEELVRVLAEDAGRRPMPLGWVLALAVAAGVVLAGAAFFTWIGVRPDYAAAWETVRHPFKFVLTLSLSAAAIGVVRRLARPGGRTGAWRLALLVAPLLLGMAVLAELVVVPMPLWGDRLIGTNALECLTLIPLLSLGPLACLLLALRHGAPTRPDRAGAAAGLLASGIAASFYAANCFDDSPLFVGTWYPLAMTIVVLIGRSLGGRLLRW